MRKNENNVEKKGNGCGKEGKREKTGKNEKGREKESEKKKERKRELQDRK